MRLELSGARLSATGAAHIAGALARSSTLESLVLAHNCIAVGDEAGLAELCHAVRACSSLRHLDLRGNGIRDPASVSYLGDMLRGGCLITHAELSWNPIGVEAGEALYERLRTNTQLFDCQLTGCGLGEETLLKIAQLLLRNRKAHGVDLEAGPYRLRTGPALAAGVPGPARLEAAVASEDRTHDFLVRLRKWQSHWQETPNTWQFKHAEDVIESLTSSQRRIMEDSFAVKKVRERVELLLQGSRDRQERYRGDIAEAKRKLSAFAKEQQEQRAVMDHLTEELGQLQGAWDEERLAERQDTRLREAEEAMLKKQIAGVEEETRALQRFQKACLEEERQQAEEKAATARENAAMRAATAAVHEDVSALCRSLVA